MDNRSIGQFYENITVQYLKDSGYSILGQNYFCRYGEIDIIAKLNDRVVFLEVKSLQQGNGYYLEETISKRKLNRLYLAIKRWLFEHKCTELDWQLDFVGISTKNSKCLLTHLDGVELY